MYLSILARFINESFKILKEFQGCLSIQLSKICIAQTQYLSGVLSLICYRLPRRLVYNIIRFTHCQQLFSKSFKKLSKSFQFFCFFYILVCFLPARVSLRPLVYLVPAFACLWTFSCLHSALTSNMLRLGFSFWTSSFLLSTSMSNPQYLGFSFGLQHAFPPL